MAPSAADASALPPSAVDALDACKKAIASMERALEPFTDADRRAVERKLRPLERALVHLEAARAMTALFALYLKTLGVEPGAHACAKEAARVEAYAKKIEDVRARVGDGEIGANVGVRKAKVDVRAAGRMIRAGGGKDGAERATTLLRAALEKVDDDDDKDDGDEGKGKAGKSSGAKKRAGAAGKVSGKATKKGKK